MKRLLTLIPFLALGYLTSCFEIDLSNIFDEPEFVEPEGITWEFELGRALFYDKTLSADKSVACGSCHKQEFGFSDNVSFSSGVHGRVTNRNSMPIQNLVLEPFVNFDSSTMTFDTISATPLFWDGREEDIFKMVLQPFTNPNEQGLKDLDELMSRVKSNEIYNNAFENIFGAETADPEHISMALTIFISSIFSGSTRFDDFQFTGQGLTEQEILGKDLFFEKYDCNACHQVQSTSGYLSVNNGFSNIGLETRSEDPGRQNATDLPEDAGKFKIPSLRNVVQTAPYMHDGRFATLEEVIEHYSTNIQDNPNLDSLLHDEFGDPLVLNITDEEKTAIVAFLGTLTDENTLNDPQFSDPFDQP
ncbi:MAG: cytochrome-c peroxidase [Bacteroidota bacterium]